MKLWVVEDSESCYGWIIVIVQADTEEEAKRKASTKLKEISYVTELEFDTDGISKEFLYIE